MLKVCKMKFYQDILNGFKFTERFFQRLLLFTKFKNTQPRIMVFALATSSYGPILICMKFYEDILKGFKVIKPT